MTDQLSATFAALADPTRRAILERLRQGECSVGDLAAPFAETMSMPAVSKHLRVLEKAGLISQRREAQWRRCRVEARALKPILDWTEHYRELWEGRLDRMDDYLKELQGSSKHGTRKQQNRSKK